VELQGLKVDDHGKPFETIGVHGAPLYHYDGRRWSPTSDFQARALSGPAS
jgi:hypothetical protein